MRIPMQPHAPPCTTTRPAIQRASLAADYEAYLARQRASQDPPRDKWITPLLDWQVRGEAVAGRKRQRIGQRTGQRKGQGMG